MCPLCGEVLHLNVGNIAKWYQERFPGLSVDSLVPGKCFYCWQELQDGDAIIVRDSIRRDLLPAAGVRGQLIATVSSDEHGAIYLVRLESGVEQFFLRGELRKLRENE
jgi:hypothetical protein